MKGKGLSGSFLKRDEGVLSLVVSPPLGRPLNMTTSTMQTYLSLCRDLVNIGKVYSDISKL